MRKGRRQKEEDGKEKQFFKSVCVNMNMNATAVREEVSVGRAHPYPPSYLASFGTSFGISIFLPT